ncbi:MAG: hypothetical protein JXR77_14845 [Lentisphaeria bacterium]|nr:hypothetical protein [Lentisphaeria bacterium]
MQSWIWRQLRVHLPDDWELLQFTRNPATGRCVFADRYQFRFELDWRQVSGRPDMERILGDYRGRLEEDGLKDPRRISHGGREGVSAGLPDGRASSRFGLYFEAEQCLVEAVFLWPRRRHDATEAAVLDSIAPEPVTPSGQGRWKAFGLDLRTGAHYTFEKCIAEPARHQVSFSAEKRRVWDHFSRRGMVEQWLDVGLSPWLRRQVRHGYRVEREVRQERATHTLHRLQAYRRHVNIVDLMYGRRRVDAACWICPEDGRLYHLSREAPMGRRPRTRPGAALRCCGGLEVAL